MSKKKDVTEVSVKMTNEELDFFQSLAKDVGGDILDSLDNCPGFIDTGVLAVNYICSGKFVGGGLPIGAMAEVAGASATGKSLFGTNVLRGCQTYNGVPVFHDAEHAVSKDFAIKASHVDPKKLIVTEADTLESSFNKIHKVIRQARGAAKIPMDRPLCIVYDSIAVSPSEREFAQTTLDMEEATKTAIKEAGAGPEKPGERARICSSELRKLMPIVKETNSIILFVNQLRTNIGVMYGDPDTEAGGGKALKYYCSTRLRMYSYKTIKDSKDRIIGTNVTFKNTKSRFVAPFQEARNVHLFFDKGIDPFGGLLELMLQLGRVEQSGGPGNYKIAEPWANGQVHKFKASKENNVIPFEVLINCPAVVDADSADQVQYYVEMFGEAHEAVNTDIAKEETISGEVD
jgi:recombination protein RecA